MVYQKRFQEFEWVVYIGDSIGNNPLKKRIICSTNNNNGGLEETEVFINSLYNYPDTEPINPISKANMKYETSYIYETYNINNLVN